MACNRFVLWTVVGLALCVLWNPPTVLAQGCDKPNMLIVLDNSNSMRNNNKLNDANKAITYVVKTFDKSIRFGLMTFCGTKKQPVVPVVVKISDTSNAKVLTSLPSKLCYGTPMVGTMAAIKQYVTKDLIPNDPKQPRPNFVMFVTDGASTDGDPTSGVKGIRTLTVGGKSYDIKTFVVGFGKGVRPQTLTSMAKAGGTTDYYQANDYNSLQKALTSISQQVSKEVCDGKDNDCNGQVDETWPKLGQTCSAGSGPCKDSGTWVCNSQGTDAVCNAKSRQPTAEVCDGKDNDCNGKVDDGIVCECQNGDERDCATACGKGKQQCSKNQWGPCKGAPTPSPEVCDGKDNDCDGDVDENLVQACKSACGDGTKRCSQGTWGKCVGSTPTTDTCDGLDNDCDGKVDNGATCPDNAPCQDGACVRPCRQGECIGNARCVKGFCVPTQTCDKVSCPSHQRCVAGACVDLCYQVTCPDKTICHKGKCYPTTCDVVGCPEGETCDNGACKPSPCANKSCAKGEECTNGVCVPTCQNVQCKSGETCVKGQCERDSCDGVSCKNNQICMGGVCQQDPCASITCPKGKTCREGECQGNSKDCSQTGCPQGSVCLDGTCLENCKGQTCAEGQTCTNNACKGTPSGPETFTEPSSEESPTQPTENPTTPTESPEQENVSKDAGTPHDDTSQPTTRKPAGCSCDSNSPAGPVFLAFVMVLFGFLRRR